MRQTSRAALAGETSPIVIPGSSRGGFSLIMKKSNSSSRRRFVEMTEDKKKVGL
jgi:hypothetical protein